jgi:outer membrane protein assembly factor BamB
MKTSPSLRYTAAFFLAATLAARSADWPQFGGPNRNLTSPETGLMKTWPAGGPRQLWSVAVGKGFGGVAIADGAVYILDREEETADILRCLDLETGDERWRYRYAAAGKISFPGSRSHPTLDDNNVYIMSPFGELRCVSRRTHKPLWVKDILATFGGNRPNWAYSQAPGLYENLVVVAPITPKAGLVAYKKESGTIAWKSEAIEGKIAYGSPMLVTIDGIDQFLVATTSCIAGIAAKSGKLLWVNSDWECKIPCSSPAYLEEGWVLMTGGYDAESIMLRVRRQGSTFTAETVFKTKQCNGQIHQPIRVGDHIYLNGNDKSKRAGFMCMGFDGHVNWKTGHEPGFDWGGALYADGMIYAVDGTRGDLVMIKPDPMKYIEVARANFLSGPKQWATIAMSNGKILLRDQTQLKCVDVRHH